MNELLVIKIGGNIIDDEARLALFLEHFSILQGHKILVHGGGKIATAIGAKLGLEPAYHNGRRITDAATLELTTMVYGGLLNKKIVAGLQAQQCNAIGLSGCDGNIVRAVKRPVKEVDFGFVGDVTETGVQVEVLNTLLQAGLVPVLAPLTHDGHGTLLNTNADTIAQEVARAFAPHYAVKLIFCFEKAGVLRQVDDESSVIQEIDLPTFRNLVDDGTIAAGMVPKLENAFSAIQQGVKKVIIGSADDLAALITGKSGTHIQ
jgi:acetylglutamate kinase